MVKEFDVRSIWAFVSRMTASVFMHITDLKFQMWGQRDRTGNGCLGFSPQRSTAVGIYQRENDPRSPDMKHDFTSQNIGLPARLLPLSVWLVLTLIHANGTYETGPGRSCWDRRPRWSQWIWPLPSYSWTCPCCDVTPPPQTSGPCKLLQFIFPPLSCAKHVWIRLVYFNDN